MILLTSSSAEIFFGLPLWCFRCETSPPEPLSSEVSRNRSQIRLQVLVETPKALEASRRAPFRSLLLASFLALFVVLFDFPFELLLAAVALCFRSDWRSDARCSFERLRHRRPFLPRFTVWVALADAFVGLPVLVLLLLLLLVLLELLVVLVVASVFVIAAVIRSTVE